jgi:diguanylate cyclase
VESLEQVAALVNEARESLLREKRAIIEFLERVNSRIEELDRHVQGASQEQQRSFDSGHEFAAAVQMQVRGIEQSVQSAVDLDQLKQSVQSGLDALHVRIVAQRASETERHAAAQRQLHALTEKLRCMEGESEQLRERLHQERQLALRDGLTDLPNRLAYKERVEYEHARWRRYAAPLALLVWDVDRFKAINDTYGHKAGDKALKTIAQLLQSQLRKTDFLARYGGEEFIMLMPETPLRDARAVAEKLLAAVANSRFHYREQAVPISISCGLTEFCGQDTPETAFERADQAMYRAKQAGGNRCHSAKCAG